MLKSSGSLRSLRARLCIELAFCAGPAGSAKVSPDVAAAKEMVAHAKGKLELQEYEVKVLPQVDVIPIRQRLGLPQAEFARRFGFSPRAVREWEQGRRKPESAARAYLLVIARDPKAADSALRGAA
jgi:putative transcriptional regulator